MNRCDTQKTDSECARDKRREFDSGPIWGSAVIFLLIDGLGYRAVTALCGYTGRMLSFTVTVAFIGTFFGSHAGGY